MVRHSGNNLMIKIMKKTILLFAIAASLSALMVSCATDSIGGTVADVNENTDKTAWEWLEANQPEVALCFEKGGYKELLNNPDEDLMILAPSKYAVSRYVKRRNADFRAGKEGAVEFKLSEIEDTNSVLMSMYIFKGAITRDDIKAGEGQYITAIDDSTDVYFSLDYTNTDPGAAYDGGGTPGYGYQYSNFLQQTPELFHALFQRGTDWETSYGARSALNWESPECDQFYRMELSDIRVKNGVIHVLYSGDSTYNEHYYYHTLFFYGTRSMDR